MRRSYLNPADAIHATAADIEYSWTEYADPDIAKAAKEAVAALRKLAHLIAEEN